ncbi:MAG TPA: hypothetical protein VK391_05115 [Allosphingosinicella sp.]|jgi:hypothetical protein|nr:hypothetical protein [Allosphingosinicella sp.]
MAAQEEIEFHSERAEAELDLALSANSVQAARAHFGLSVLHVDKMQSLAGAEPSAEGVSDH